VARLIPNPLADTLGRADITLRQVDHVLERVDSTLSTVSTTLTSVEGTLEEASAVLVEVRDLLIGLRARLELLDQVPLLATQMAEVHAAVCGTTAKATRARKSS